MGQLTLISEDQPLLICHGFAETALTSQNLSCLPMAIVNDQNFSTNFPKGSKTSHQCKLLIESSSVANHDFAFTFQLQ